MSNRDPPRNRRPSSAAEPQTCARSPPAATGADRTPSMGRAPLRHDYDGYKAQADAPWPIEACRTSSTNLRRTVQAAASRASTTNPRRAGPRRRPGADQNGMTQPWRIVRQSCCRLASHKPASPIGCIPVLARHSAKPCPLDSRWPRPLHASPATVPVPFTACPRFTPMSPRHTQ